MSKPKNMTPEQEAAWREKKRAIEKAWYEANREKKRAWKKADYEANHEKSLAQNKAWREANREKKRAIDKAWYEANHEKILDRDKAWREANREKKRAIDKASIEKLTDCYVALRLGLPVKHVPPDLLELKRQQLQLKRATKKLKQHLTEATE